MERNRAEVTDADFWAEKPKEKAGGWNVGLGEQRGDIGSQPHSPSVQIRANVCICSAPDKAV